MIKINKNLLKEIIYIFFNSLSISITIWSCFFYTYFFNFIFPISGLHLFYYFLPSVFLVVSWRVFMLLLTMLLLENFKNTTQSNNFIIDFYIFIFVIWISLLDILAVSLWLFLRKNNITGLNSYFVYIILIVLFFNIINSLNKNNKNGNK